MARIKPARKGMYREALSVAWPAVIESVFISLAAMIDMNMVSSIGSDAVAAVGLTTQPRYLLLSPFFAANIAVATYVAWNFGAKNRKAANEFLLTALIYVGIASLVLGIICVILAEPIILFCGGQPETMHNGVLYFRIVVGCMIFNVLSMLINAAQRGAGFTKVAMYANVTSAVANVCMDYLLIGGQFGFPALGVAGAALATVLASALSFGISFYSMLRDKRFISLSYIRKERLRPSLASVKQLNRDGSPLFKETLATRLGFFLTGVMAARIGTDPFAVHQVGMTFMNLAFAFGDGMQSAVLALAGRSMGEKDPKKAEEYGAVCQRIGLVLSITLAAVMLIFGRFLFGLFFDEPALINMGVMVSCFIAVTIPIQISQIIYNGTLRGVGDTKYTLFAAFISVTIVNPLVTALLTIIFPLGLIGIWIGVLSNQFTRQIMLHRRFARGKWKEISM